MYLIIPLSEHPNARGSGLIVVWQDPQTRDAVLAAEAGFIASIGNTGAAFAGLFETEDAARAAIAQYRSPGFVSLPEIDRLRYNMLEAS